MEQQQQSNPLLNSPPELTPTEQDVLDEYERLAENMKKLASVLDTLASQPSVAILDGLRELERKTSLVFTLMKASVYSIVLQQEIDWGGPAAGENGGGGGGGGGDGPGGAGSGGVGEQS
ncbi:DASH complex subunit Dad3 domain-containing protein [Neurospora intermedia]|uniref:DASH complex subunit DAD3 n=1 Tax=Neurospora intermedia TaxID=5142 RepID=A0ABR3DDE4_NEUIN